MKDRVVLEGKLAQMERRRIKIYGQEPLAFLVEFESGEGNYNMNIVIE